MSADAYEIEALATQRLATEYIEAQDRGEVQKAGGERTSIIPDRNNAPAITDIGLTSKQVFEGRRLRAAEAIDPGIVRRAAHRRPLGRFRSGANLNNVR